jgi:hypothetical protein
MNRIYLYAIIPAAAHPPLTVDGVWPGEPQVGTIGAGALAAVVGAAPPVDFHAISREDAVRYLLAHQRVVEAVMQTSAALPVKFGTTLPDADAVIAMLARGAAILAPPLAELAQHVQLELIVTWNVADILPEIAAEDAIVQLKAEIAAQVGGPTDEQRIAIGRLVKQSIDRHRETCRSRILAAVRSVAADMVENALMDDRMVANLALLLSKDAGEAFDRQLAALDEEFGQRLNFRSIGPLPPYSFATVEVNLPSFDAVDRARRMLSLGESAGLAEIKSAYRQQIRRMHPDLATVAPIEGGDAGQLTNAYKTLMNYAGALPSAAGDDPPGDSGYRFDRGAVESSILVMVRRPELATLSAELQP